MKRIISFLIFLLIFSSSSFGDEKGDEILKRSFERRRVKNLSEKVTMLLIDKGGGQRKREILIKSKEIDNLMRSYALFLYPPDVQGTKFLMIENAGKSDDQFLYLPSLKKVRRISGGSKKGSFMGSDFTYEDMELGDVEDSENRYIKDEEIAIDSERFLCHVIESVSKRSRDSQYSKVISWISRDSFIPRRVDLFNKKGEEFKRLIFKKVKEDRGHVIFTEMEMTNLLKGSKTILKVDNYSIDREEIPDEIFTPAYLERER